MFRVLALILICSAAGVCAGLPSAAELARSVRDAALDPEECYRVRDLSFRKEDIRLYFTEGYLIFSKPAAGERVSAVFTTNLEGGDGEVILLPPTRGERRSLVTFTQSPNLDEHIGTAIMIFTNGTGALLRDRVAKEEASKKVPEMGALMAAKWSPVLTNIRQGFELRMVDDLLSPDASASGFMFFVLAGRERGNFDILYDPRAREQIVAGQLSERNGRPRYNIWTSFMAKDVRTGAAKRFEPGFALSHFSIDATLDTNLHMKALTKINMRVGAAALRSFPFEVSGAMKVTAVRVDGKPAETLAPDSVRVRGLRGSEDDGLLVVTPETLAPGSEHRFEFEHEGDVITSAGNGVYFVGARATWYPRSTAEFSTYDLTFHYPKKLTLVTAGDVVDDRIDGDTRITRRRTDVPIRFAGFNLGEYERITGTAPGFSVEVYGNRRLEAALQPRPAALIDPSASPMTMQQRKDAMQAPMSLAPDPLARLHAVSANVSSSLEFYSGLFGAPALKTLTVAPIPGTFGQGFPGLVYLSTIAYLDPASRPAILRTENQQVFFSDLMAAHEVAHQWWGNVVITSSYQDEWLMEALANYSAMLWLEKRSGPKAVESVLDDYRTRLLSKDAEGRTVESAGPIVWGMRLDSAGIPDAWRSITYEKGAWIMHMLRKRLGDDRFLKMLAELRRRYEFRSITSEEFRALAAEFLPPHTASGAMDTFFDNWVYATGIPVLKLQSSTKGFKVSGTLTQSGVDNDFSADVPVEIQFAKGASQTVWVRTSNDPVPFSVTVKQPPSHVSLGAYSVLAAKK
ncbi:MAG: M1 family aminopeptidase [Bryobacteraceae bacterium]